MSYCSSILLQILFVSLGENYGSLVIFLFFKIQFCGFMKLVFNYSSYYRNFGYQDVAGLLVYELASIMSQNSVTY